jgi:hypothetical protein
VHRPDLAAGDWRDLVRTLDVAWKDGVLRVEFLSTWSCVSRSQGL